jgi:hypothetical protein
MPEEPWDHLYASLRTQPSSFELLSAPNQTFRTTEPCCEVRNYASL